MDKLISVTRLNQSHYLTLGKIPVGTHYQFLLSPDGAIVMAPSDDPSPIPTVRTVVRYNNSHCNGIIIPQTIWCESGFQENQSYALIDRGNDTYLIRPATPDEMQFQKITKPITRDGTVRLGRYLYLTKSQKSALGIGTELYKTGVNLKFTFDFLESHTMVVEPLSQEEAKTLPPMQGYHTPGYFNTKRIVQRHVSGPIILPAEFCRRYNILTDDTIASDTTPGKIIFYGNKKNICSFCGNEHKKIATKNAPVCSDCANAIPEIRKAIQDYGGVTAAISASKTNLADTLNRRDALKEDI